MLGLQAEALNTATRRGYFLPVFVGLVVFAWLVQDSVWLTFNSWVPGAIILLIAGAFQFSALKYSCLDKCRTPMLFINQHWQGHHELRQSLLLGIHHGIYCVGCCWALMLLMFAIGTGSVGWMLALGAVMAVEKNMPWGRKMSGPLGVSLLAWSGLIVWSNAQSQVF